MAGFLEIIKTNKIIQFALIAIVIYFAITYMMPTETLENTESTQAPAPPKEEKKEEPVVEKPQVVGGTLGEPEIPAAPVQEKPAQIEATELLPKYDEANEFAQQNPVSKLLKEQNFLISGYHIGVNTVMQSNKIPYHDLRSVPPIPKESVGPFLQSSYENPMGAGRRQLEVGA
jgi:hypothetical protein